MKATQEKPWRKYYDPETIDVQVPELSLIQYLKQSLPERENKIALIYQDQKITMDELLERVYAVADAFAGLGVKRGDSVVVVSITTPEIVYTIYALSLIGAVPNMVDPRFSEQGIRECINEVQAKYVMTLTAVYDKVAEAVKETSAEKIIVLSPVISLPKFKQFLYGLKNPFPKNMPENFLDWEAFMAYGKGVKAEEVTDRAHDCCIIVHTGGTTGPSKSVMLSDFNLNSISWEFKKTRMLGLNSGHDKVLNVMPPFIAYGFGYGIHLPLCNRMTSIIIPVLDASKLGHLIKRYRPNEITGVPYHFQTLMRDPVMKNMDLSFLTKIGIGGDAMTIPLELEIQQWLKDHHAPNGMMKGYGMTELSAFATACMQDLDKPGSVGVPAGSFIIAAFDPETGEEMELGETGEICVHGPTMMMGYYGNQEETDKVLRTHADGLKWIHTGDLGYVDEDGFVFLIGRMKRMFMNWFGYKIFPGVVENAVSQCKDVETCCVVPTPNREKGRGFEPVVYYTVGANCGRTKEDLEAELEVHCKKELPEYMYPKCYQKLETMPRTPIGKVDFVKLEESASQL